MSTAEWLVIIVSALVGAFYLVKSAWLARAWRAFDRGGPDAVLALVRTSNWPRWLR